MGLDENAEATLVRGAEKESTYLKQFGRPLLPFQRTRREAYQYQKQSPSDHIQNLQRYLLVAPSLVPGNPALRQFRLRHPDLQPSNIIIDSQMRIVAMIDWQHTSILPLFLHSGIPQQLQNYNDPISQHMTHPSLPENIDAMEEDQQSYERELYRRRLVHYHYVRLTKEHNEQHYVALTDRAGALRRRLFCHASDPWEGETLALSIDLIDSSDNWATLAGNDTPCPVAFDAEDMQKTRKLDAEQSRVDETFEALQNMIGFGPEGWVPAEHYEEAMERSKQLKDALTADPELSEEEKAQTAAHWPLDDMDEEEYM